MSERCSSGISEGRCPPWYPFGSVKLNGDPWIKKKTLINQSSGLCASTRWSSVNLLVNHEPLVFQTHCATSVSPQRALTHQQKIPSSDKDDVISSGIATYTDHNTDRQIVWLHYIVGKTKLLPRRNSLLKHGKHVSRLLCPTARMSTDYA